MKEDKYKKKYNLNKDNDLTNKYLTSISNPTVQPDRKTEWVYLYRILKMWNIQRNTKKKTNYKNGSNAFALLPLTFILLLYILRLL